MIWSLLLASVQQPALTRVLQLWGEPLTAIDLIAPPVPLLKPRSHGPPARRKILHFRQNGAGDNFVFRLKSRLAPPRPAHWSSARERRPAERRVPDRIVPGEDSETVVLHLLPQAGLGGRIGAARRRDLARAR